MSILDKVREMANEVKLGERDTWEQYFMSNAYISSLRSTCGSRRVGAVVINGLEQGERKILATGYNGNPPGDSHCINGGCARFKAREDGLIKSGEYNDDYPCFAFHAEANALNQMLQLGIPSKGCIMFTTTSPCRQCCEKLLGAGIKKIYYSEGYPDDMSKRYMDKYGMEAILVE